MNKVPVSWRTSSFSADTECVQVANTLRAVRDSKNSGGPVLTVNVSTFVAIVKADVTQG